MMTDPVDHPAKFSKPILETLGEMVPLGARVLDPFAGVGLIHTLDADTYGVEIEPEWAGVHPRTIVANALHLPFADGEWPWVVTSPCYGNRFADHYNARERCRMCDGAGHTLAYPDDGRGSQPCEKCGGEGYRKYKRYNYRTSLGRDVHPESAAKMQWGLKYRKFHREVWREVYRVLSWDGRFILNISNHYRNHEIARVAEWHLMTLVDPATFRGLSGRGFYLERIETVDTSRMGHGENFDARCPYEYLFQFRIAT